MRSNPGKISKVKLRGSELRAVLDAYNKIPPESFLAADFAVIYRRPNFPNVALAFVEGGCVVASGQISLPLLLQWLRNASGTPQPPVGSSEA